MAEFVDTAHRRSSATPRVRSWRAISGGGRTEEGSGHAAGLGQGAFVRVAVGLGEAQTDQFVGDGAQDADDGR